MNRRTTIIFVGLVAWLVSCGLLTWLSAEFQYALLTMRPYPEHEVTPAMQIAREQEEQHNRAIVYELWLNQIIPPPLRQHCYTGQRFVCDFIDRYPKARSTGWSYWQNTGLVSGVALIPALLSSGLVWWVMRRRS